MANAFDSADFYDCKGVERFDFLRLDECIEDYVDGLCAPGCDVAERIQASGTLTVSAHGIIGVTAESAKLSAQSLLEMAQEHWDEEFGDPEGDSADFSGFLPRLEALVIEMWNSEKPWRCEKVASREFSADEVEAIARKSRPDWFEAKTTSEVQPETAGSNG